jgi:predicted TIM-barrel fold metal-dependent hydrolase
MLRNVFLVMSMLLLPFILQAQTMTIEEYEPKSTLIVPQHEIKRAKFPFIDVHNHQSQNISPGEVDTLVQEMDKLNLRVMVNLSGGTGATLKKVLQNMVGRYPNRFVVFCNLSYDDVDDPEYGRKSAARLEQDYRNGARGLKIFKNLGLTLKDKNGRRIPTNDPRFDPVWAKCAELGIPVLIHTGEPRSFFDPIDRFNERWFELKQFPDRARPPEEFPPWEQVMGEQHSVFAKHPKTIFINAHLGWLGGDLARLGALMDKYPNMYTELGAVLAEIARQPRFAREWFIKHQDRIMMGKDTWAPAEYFVYFRVFETADEYFDYYRKRHAFWKIYGLDLPAEVLKKIYYKNALRILPGIDEGTFPD